MPEEDSDPPKKKRKANQYSVPPDEELLPYIRLYWVLGYSDPKIAEQVMDHFDRSCYTVSKQTVQRRRTEMGLLGTRQRAVTWEELEPIYDKLRQKFPNMGARSMVTTLRQQHGIKVPESFLLQAFKVVDADGVQRRKRKKFKRKCFYAAGVMDIICFDQHDKWKRFGLWLHIGLEPFSGRIVWLRIWWTNRNSKLVTSYYINGCRPIGGIPLITQSDLGSENYGIANCHTVTRQRLDPSLVGTLQHRWMNKKAMNVKPEVAWSGMRRNFTPGFEDVLDKGTIPDAQGNTLYDLLNPLHRLVFRWLAIPWLQTELNAWVKIFNSSPRRADKNKILPQGIPDMIMSKPEQFGTTDYKVIITPELFDEMEATWAPLSDPVFKLVPDTFDRQISGFYEALGHPEVSLDTFWMIYSSLLNAFSTEIQDGIQNDIVHADDNFELSAALIPAQANLPVYGDLGYEYLGGLPRPPALTSDGDWVDEDVDGADVREYAEFTDDEPDFE
ncbi:hypothetical protein K438DRAFT_2002219 [Mycena galopus ATCC 62051]|nr:hypothetical protein K438DRAFT_2002219 [Mycena galopus ATCC 62051]